MPLLQQIPVIERQKKKKKKGKVYRMPNPQQIHGAQHTLSDKMLAASTHVVRHHNHRGAKNRGRYSLQCFRS